MHGLQDEQEHTFKAFPNSINSAMLLRVIEAGFALPQVC